jgi:hypothetical protein
MCWLGTGGILRQAPRLRNRNLRRPANLFRRRPHLNEQAAGSAVAPNDEA